MLNQEVLRLENESEGTPNLSGLSLAPDRFPIRPGFGKRGEQVRIWANYFQLLVDARLVLYQYNIDIQPEVLGRKRTRIIQLVLQRPEFVARSDNICSDFKSTLFSRAVLDNEITACNMQYRSEFETEPGPRATLYQIRLQHTRTLPVRRLLEYLTTTNLSYPFDERSALIQAFNVFLNHFAKSHDNLVTFGNKTFPRDAAGRDLGGGLMAVRGFFSSVRIATGRILVNVNVCCSAFYRPGSLTTLMAAHGLQDRYRLEQFLKGVRVKTCHTRTPRIKTILALASPSDGQGSNQQRPRVPEFGATSDQVLFWLREHNRYVTVSDYFRRCKIYHHSKGTSKVTNVFNPSLRDSTGKRETSCGQCRLEVQSCVPASTGLRSRGWSEGQGQARGRANQRNDYLRYPMACSSSKCLGYCSGGTFDGRNVAIQPFAGKYPTVKGDHVTC